MGKIGCAAIVRNEARHIAEWLAWQIILGFDTILLLDNASTDDTAAIARGFAPQFDVRVIDYPNRAPDYQLRSYEMLAGMAAAEGFEWLAFFDADEFLRLDDGLTLKSVLAARPEAAIAIPWAMFGSNGHQDIPPGLTVEAFDHRSEPGFEPNRHVKSIVRPELVISCPCSHGFLIRGAYVDLLGRPVQWGPFLGRLAGDPDYAGGAVNHYFTRSAADWREKLARGYPNITRELEHFDFYDRNEVEDRRLVGRGDEIRAVIAGEKPVFPPEPAPPAPPPALPAVPPVKPRTHKYRYAIAACARWETPYVAEWLAYHRAIGFEHVFLYCNDDDPALFYEAVLPFTQGPAPFVTFHHFAEQGQHRQMMLHFAAHHARAAEWVSFLDLDEFLRLPEGETLDSFMEGFADRTDCVMFNWAFFGPNGQLTPPDSVLRRLTTRAASLHPLTKLLFRSYVLGLPELFRNAPGNAFVHRVDEFVQSNLRPMNVLGEDMTGYYRAFPEQARAWLDAEERGARILASGAMVNHYAFRTEGAFIERAARGLGGDFAGEAVWADIGRDETQLRAFIAAHSAVEDLALAQRWARIIAPAYAAPAARVPDPPALPVPKATTRRKVAVVLILKDEATDILGWLAWYRMQGVDAAIVYDDDSTDGTWEILLDAARNFDIRLQRTPGDRAVIYQLRQLASYRHALATYRDEFEWLGFFDADEYVLLHQDKDIPALLARLDHAAQICIPWCQFGSSGHVLKPALPAPLAYTHRNVETDAINRHVKSFVRPEAVGPVWRNVHAFDVPPSLTVLADGGPVEFGETSGILAGPPSWAVARVAHYQCRSMEHFIERLRRRPVFAGKPWLWAFLDVKTVQDQAALVHAAALQENIDALLAPPAPPPPPKGESAYLIDPADPALVQAALDAAPLVIAVAPDVRQFYALSEAFAGALAAGRLKLENAAPAAHGGDIVLFSPPDGSAPYHVVTIDWAELQAKYGPPASVLMSTPVPGFPLA